MDRQSWQNGYLDGYLGGARKVLTTLFGEMEGDRGFTVEGVLESFPDIATREGRKAWARTRRREHRV